MEDWESSTFSKLAVIGASVDVQWQKNESVYIYFFCHFLTPKFNNRNIMIEPI